MAAPEKAGLEALWQAEPLYDNIDRITPFVDVSRYYKLRICGHSDTLTDVQLDWSPDGVERALTSAIKIGSGMWRSEEQKVLFPFVRLHVINSSGKNNGALKITVHSFGPQNTSNAGEEMRLPPAAQEAPAAPAELAESDAPMHQVRFAINPSPRSIDDANAAAAPPKKRNWIQKRMSPKHTCRDDRLPGFLPFNSILTTDKKGNVVPLAPGNRGDVLTMTASGPTWVAPLSETDTEIVND